MPQHFNQDLVWLSDVLFKKIREGSPCTPKPATKAKAWVAVRENPCGRIRVLYSLRIL